MISNTMLTTIVSSAVQSLITLFLGSIGMDDVISELSYKGNILQRNYRKMTIHGHFPIIPL